MVSNLCAFEARENNFYKKGFYDDKRLSIDSAGTIADE